LPAESEEPSDAVLIIETVGVPRFKNFGIHSSDYELFTLHSSCLV
jgi:hypothetical protein